MLSAEAYRVLSVLGLFSSSDESGQSCAGRGLGVQEVVVGLLWAQGGAPLGVRQSRNDAE